MLDWKRRSDVQDAEISWKTYDLSREALLIDQLMKRFGLSDIIDHFSSEGRGPSEYEKAVASLLRLSPLLAPRLFSIFSSVIDYLDFREEVELLVEQHSSVNAHSYSGHSRWPNVICSTNCSFV